MKPNLDVLKPEIELHLEEMGMAVFYGHSRALDTVPVVYWDCEQYPDYRLFVQSAHTAGAKIVVFHQREFFSEQVDDALERLHACELPSQESRSFEERLSDLRAHEGSVCAIELSFDHEGRVFLFDLRTDWYDEFSDMLDEIQLLTAEPDNGDDSPISGYFSRN
ncbi:MAG TPA: hypothetical protein VK724_08970 [Bryobacteraceae bacterium]|jgi:hypothetical protein|nr:hypothetical protein [Bryobacteraceae bacterium]